LLNYQIELELGGVGGGGGKEHNFVLSNLWSCWYLGVDIAITVFVLDFGFN
jgi:hypothetical protein